MKKQSISLASLVLFFATGAAIGMETPINTTIQVYVMNEAKSTISGGYEVLVKLDYDLKYLKMGRDGGIMPGQTEAIPFGESKYIGQLNAINDVRISGPKAYDWSTHKDMLDTIKKESTGYDDFSKVYLYVVSGASSYYISRWRWFASEEAQAKPSGLISFDFSDLPTQLQDIIKGTWGPDYAKKVIDICGADYTQVKKLGLVNLCEHLTRTLEPLFGKIRKTSQPNTFEIKTTEDEIKETINRLHKKLLEWKSQGKV